MSTSAGHASHQSILLQPGDIVVGKYEPMTQSRVTGWLLLGGGLASSGVLVTAAAVGSDDHDSGVSRTTLALVAASTLALTVALAVVFISTPAETRLRVRTPAR